MLQVFLFYYSLQLLQLATLTNYGIFYFFKIDGNKCFFLSDPLRLDKHRLVLL